MANRSRGREKLDPEDDFGPEDDRSARSRHLRVAADRLAAVLQSLDLEAEPRLAEAVVEAVRATDRAYELEGESVEETADVEAESGPFVFRPPKREKERPHDR
jgi:hypothetical protein